MFDRMEGEGERKGEQKGEGRRKEGRRREGERGGERRKGEMNEGGKGERGRGKDRIVKEKNKTGILVPHKRRNDRELPCPFHVLS